jgi:hypothetical protein
MRKWKQIEACEPAGVIYRRRIRRNGYKKRGFLRWGIRRAGEGGEQGGEGAEEGRREQDEDAVETETSKKKVGGSEGEGVISK